MSKRTEDVGRADIIMPEKKGDGNLEMDQLRLGVIRGGRNPTVRDQGENHNVGLLACGEADQSCKKNSEPCAHANVPALRNTGRSRAGHVEKIKKNT